jgi:hypothetical protein
MVQRSTSLVDRLSMPAHVGSVSRQMELGGSHGSGPPGSDMARHHHCHRMGHRLSYRALTAALWLEEVEDGREERKKQLYLCP